MKNEGKVKLAVALAVWCMALVLANAVATESSQSIASGNTSLINVGLPVNQSGQINNSGLSFGIATV